MLVSGKVILGQKSTHDGRMPQNPQKLQHVADGFFVQKMDIYKNELTFH